MLGGEVVGVVAEAVGAGVSFFLRVVEHEEEVAEEAAAADNGLGCEEKVEGAVEGY